MGFIASLNVRVGADVRRFRSKMGNARATVGKFRTSIGGLTKSLTGIVPALAGVASVAGIGALIKREMAAIDATAKLSDQLGVATEDLIKLRHAAELTGAGSKSLDAGLATMAKRLGEAARGSGAATAALKELGLEAKSLVMLSPDQAFRDIAAALEKIEEPSRRNAIAANLFSKANMGLLNTLAAGEKGLKAMGDEAERLGLTFNRVDAAKVEAANDTLTRLGSLSGRIFRDAAIALGPYITLVGEDLVAAYSKVGDAAVDAGAKMEAANKKSSSGMDTFADTIFTAGQGLRALKVFIAGTGGGEFTQAERFKGLMDILEELTPSERKEALVVEQAQLRGMAERAKTRKAEEKMRGTNVLGAARGLVQPGIDIARAFLENAKGLAGDLEKPIDKLIEFGRQMGKTIKDLNMGLTATFNEGIEFAKTLRTPLEQLGADLADLDRFLDVGAISKEIHRRGVEAAFDKAGIGGPGDQEDPNLQFSAALKRGSAAARSAILQTQAESPELKEARKRTKLLADIDRGIKETQRPRIVSIGGAVA